MGDIKLEFDDSHAAFDEKSYQRVLDLDTATVQVRYSANKVEFTRECFASSPDEVIVIKISGNKPSSLNFTVSMDSKLHHHSYVNNKSQIILDGSCPGRRIPPQVYGNDNPTGRSPVYMENDNPKGIQYSVVLDLQISDGGGELHVVDGRKLQVVGCDWAVIRLTASSSFDGPFTKPVDSKRDPSSESLSAMDSAKRYSYSGLYKRHISDYQALFHRVSLQLSNSSKNLAENEASFKKNKDMVITTAERVKSFRTYEDPSMVELLFQYGRYLLISCSRPGTQPSNLQGIWNQDTEPAWEYVLFFEHTSTF